MKTYIAFLRGINVGGKHKVPMKDLKMLLKKNSCQNIITLLNSGNVIFDSAETSSEKIQQELSELLEENFGFAIPTVVKTKTEIEKMLAENPFQSIELNKDIRLYVSFLYEDLKNKSVLESLEDDSFRLVKVNKNELFSVVDLSKGKSTKAMEKMDKAFQKQLTTRNWNTIEKIGAKLN
ncbi:DUF1697 domain-containing protein [Mesonia maritima]|uniref:Uncharacterized protein (DUF1697 family) n=1 Tax=Mesonia maritima TaxID=1793873 RepID=A0ABU1K5J5_9FLAO|nr:DUF1697 domain-containing protein [Mesonia maritima]MDR6300890.1 uncharacterized protein (DUF1697 family) [Mesonia maritima]